jgi:hypothetical protein
MRHKTNPGKPSASTTIVSGLSDELIKKLFNRDDIAEPFMTAIEGEWDCRFFDPRFEDEHIDPEQFLESFNRTFTRLIGEAERKGESVDTLLRIKLNANRRFRVAA